MQFRRHVLIFRERNTSRHFNWPTCPKLSYNIHNTLYTAILNTGVAVSLKTRFICITPDTVK